MPFLYQRRSVGTPCLGALCSWRDIFWIKGVPFSLSVDWMCCKNAKLSSKNTEECVAKLDVENTLKCTSPTISFPYNPLQSLQSKIVLDDNTKVKHICKNEINWSENNIRRLTPKCKVLYSNNTNHPDSRRQVASGLVDPPWWYLIINWRDNKLLRNFWHKVVTLTNHVASLIFCTAAL